MIRIVVQARMNSSRLPGKILAPIEGRPLLWHVVTRLRAACEFASRSGDPALRDGQVQVATTTDAADDGTADWCWTQGIACFRGSSADVLQRYVDATADLDDDDIVVRATADNPLYCPERSAAILGEHLTAVVDYTSIVDLSYVVPEVMRVGALRRMAGIAGDSYCREHVTPYFREDGNGFSILQLPHAWRGLRPEFRLTVDTPQELARMRQIFERCQQGDPLFPLERVYAYCAIVPPRQASRPRAGSTCPNRAYAAPQNF